MIDANLENEIIEFFRQNIVNGGSLVITGDTLLKEDLGLDSVDFVELIMKLEDKYEVKISDEDAKSLRTIGCVSTLISTLKEQS